MLRRKHLELVASHSVRHGMRGGAGLISIFMTLITGLVLAQCTVAPLELMDKQKAKFSEQLKAEDLDPQMRGELAAQQGMLDGEVNKKVISAARSVIDWVVEPSGDEQLDYMTKERPAMVTAFLVLLMLFTPFLTCLSGFNQTSSDISSRGLRFLLIRTERTNIFLGRLIGTYLFSALVFLLLFVVLGMYMAAKVHVHPKADMIFWLAHGYLRVMVFVMPYMALCAWISCAIDSAFGSLIISLLLAYMYPWVISLGSKIQPVIAYGQYLTPFGYKWWLFEPFGLKFIGGLLIMLAFTALLTFTGNRYFGKRDL
ncbi:MAG: hypothetical protein NT062_26735 [Proteobacteria bacterium]|nr:hypothetical protein [Pseudomonadota bacterium]